MSYKDIETSWQSEPIELYEITIGYSRWLYTTSNTVITIGSSEYLPAAIKRGDTSDDGDATKANLSVSIARDTPLADVFRIQPPSEPVILTIKQYHRNDSIADWNLKLAVIWKGRIINAKWNPDQSLTFTSESVFSSLLRSGCTRKYSRYCTHTLYGAGCNLAASAWAVKVSAGAVNGTFVTVSTGKPDHYFTGGYATWENKKTGNIERRTIIHFVGGTITLGAFPLGLESGTAITLYPGCNHTLDECTAKFNNTLNFGGQPFIPTKNPFGSSPIY